MFESVKTIASVVGGLYDRYRRWLDARDDTDALEKLLCLELRRNLALLDALRLDDSPQDSPAFLEVAKLLETEVLEQMFLPGKGSALLRERIGNREREDDTDPGDSAPMANHLMRLYVRIIAIQKLAALPQDAQGLRSIRYGQRLCNIRDRSARCLKRLEDFASV